MQRCIEGYANCHISWRLPASHDKYLVGKMHEGALRSDEGVRELNAVQHAVRSHLAELCKGDVPNESQNYFN